MSSHFGVTTIKEKQSFNRREFLKWTSRGLATAIPWRWSQFSGWPEHGDVSLDDMIGQMLLVGFNGLEVNDEHPIVRDIREHNLGGVVLFDYDASTKTYVRNIQSPEQVRTLIQTLQAAASTPLLIALDQEGGMVCRLKKKYGFPPTVSAEYLGMKNDLEFTRQMASTMAQTLTTLGINLNLAPVVDVNVNPNNPIIGKRKRSFSSDPRIVTDHALEFIRAHHEKNVFCTLKHFPGHGSSTADSHHGLTDVTHTWSEIELEPYTNVIQTGEADVIMTAHVFNRFLDERFPATLSKSTITGILREKLSYDGVVISDDILMGAIIKEYDLRTAVQNAIEAGVDILAIANGAYFKEGVVTWAIALIKKLIRDGKLREARIYESYRRIQKLKYKLMNIPKFIENLNLLRFPGILHF